MTASAAYNFLYALSMGMAVSALACFFVDAFAPCRRPIRFVILATSGFCLVVSGYGVIVYG